MTTPGPRAVLWDLDGTLVDSEHLWIEAETELVTAFGGTWTTEQGLALVGNSLPASAKVLQEAGVDLPIEEIVRRKVARVVQGTQAGPRWCPGARELLLDVAGMGVPLALVTMSHRPIVDAVLSHLPEGIFSSVVTGERVADGKPAPDCYRLALAELGVSAAEVLAIEDSPSGVAATAAAGLSTLAVKYLAPVPGAPGRILADSLVGLGWSDLVKMFAELQRTR